VKEGESCVDLLKRLRFCICNTTRVLFIRSFHSLCQSEFSTDFELVLPLSISRRSPSSCLRFLPCLPITSVLPSTFASITCFGRRFLRKILAFLLFSFVLYRVSQEECTRLREVVPYVKVYRYNPKHLYPKLNGYGDNGQRKVWSSCGSTYCTC
jgi:hypothetical protein